MALNLVARDLANCDTLAPWASSNLAQGIIDLSANPAVMVPGTSASLRFTSLIVGIPTIQSANGYSVPVDVSKQYNISVGVYNNAAAARTVYIYARWLTAAGAFISQTLVGWTAQPAKATRLTTGLTTPPPTAAFLQPLIGYSAGVVNESIDFAGLSVSESASADLQPFSTPLAITNNAAVSTAPAVKAAIKAALVSAGVILPLSVNAPPRWDEGSGSDWVLVGTATWSANEWRSTRSKQEEYAIDVVFNTLGEDGDLEAVEARAVAEAAKLELYLMSNSGLSIPNIQSMKLNYVRQGSWPVASHNNVNGRVACTVSVIASVRR